MGSDRSPLAEDVISALGVAETDPLASLAKAFLHRLPPAVTTDPGELARRIRSLLQFISHRPGQVAVRAFNPTDDEHGYTSPGTVVEVNVIDSPFLLDSVTAEIEAHGLAVAYVIHPVIGTERDPSGRLLDIRHARHTVTRESVEHYQLDRRLFEALVPVGR